MPPEALLVDLEDRLERQQRTIVALINLLLSLGFDVNDLTILISA